MSAPVVYLADADSAIPNLALMRLATYFRERGRDVRLIRPSTPAPDLFTPRGEVYGSSVFGFADKARATMEHRWGRIRWGGTGVRVESSLSEIDATVDWDAVEPDYSLYPDFDASLGFLTRGCRLRCGFCVVPRKEGKPRAVSTLDGVWRGSGHPKHLLLLDNDAFAATLRDYWRDALAEMIARDFRVCFSQGINLRLVDEDAAEMIGMSPYYGSDFIHRTLYTAWDNLGDEGIFRRGVARLGAAGVPAHRLRVYMLVGYDPRETWESIFYRFRELVALGCDPFPMVYDRSRGDLRAFQRWALRHLYRSIPWPDYRDGRITTESRALSDAAWRGSAPSTEGRRVSLPVAS